MSDSNEETPHYGFAGRMARLFIRSRLTPIALVASVLLGVFAVLQLPREEEPQIKVPMIDIFVAMPGATAEEVENRVSRPMEKLIWEVPGVEYVYSTSEPGRSMVVARFYVGEDLEASTTALTQKLETNYDRIPHGVTTPLIKPRTIDDVPILALTLHSATYDHYTLRRLAAEIEDSIKGLPNVAETMLIGGLPRTLRVLLDPLALASRGLAPQHLISALQQANQQSDRFHTRYNNEEVLVQTGRFFQTAAELGEIVVGVHAGKPVYLREVATVVDGPDEPDDYVLFAEPGREEEAAVTITVAKRPGANAIAVVEEVMAQVEVLQPELIPADVALTVTRDYGHTAAEKSNELLLHMGIAVFGVALLILLFLGWRESVVVLFAIPSTLALTLLVFYLYGYTLNRITLFALIFSIGILVDDAIVVVENIVRHVRMPKIADRDRFQVALEAVDEVGNPTILATWAVIAAILPMAFVGGLMGPYMRPIPIGSSAAMFFSLIIAFTITPWAAVRVLKTKRSERPRSAEADTEATRENAEAGAPDPHEGEHAPNDFFTRLYHYAMEPMIRHAFWRWAFLGGIVVLLLGSMALVGIGFVKVKMLPFDNKSEFQLILNMPEGTTLETTTQVAREMAQAVAAEPEVSDYQVYAGTAAPFNFNGLVRHYYLRSGPTVADVQINLLPKHARDAQSHDVAKRIRDRVTAIAQEAGGTVAVAEVPPGPPVLQTLVAEVYGPTPDDRLALAEAVRKIFLDTPGVVDVDWYVEAPQTKVRVVVDKEKAALHGISEANIDRTVRLALEGLSIDLLHKPSEREDVDIVLELPRDQRVRPEDLLSLHVRSEHDANAPLVPLRELVELVPTTSERNRYHKNLLPVIYVTADVAGAAESPAYVIFALNEKIAALDATRFGGTDAAIDFYHLNLPSNSRQPAIKWDGEWHITLEVFRDLGIAFAVVLILIYMLMVGWFHNYVTPSIVMVAIPFSLIGILPAHGLMGAFFTATSMIGFMAGAGIVVRNSIILVDFIELRRRHGLPLAEAVVEAGAVRFRPMLLTALAVVVGASVILADPIFQGLAISLMFGEVASLLISRMAVPVLYYMVEK